VEKTGDVFACRLRAKLRGKMSSSFPSGDLSEGQIKKVAGAIIDPLHRINFGTMNRRKFSF
jgi:hypothetical protein